ncbi:MAG: O-antigen ligase family protein [Thermus sp.]|nr:O-antigen ligase family protein [Thermus sp.]
MGFLLGLGRFFGESRFMGTFNDPNQMAHWILWAVIIVLTADYAYRGRLSWVSWLALLFGVLLLLASASRSGLLGFLAIVAGVVLFLVGGGVRLRWSLLQEAAILFAMIAALTGGLLLGAASEKVQAVRERVVEQVEFYVVRIYEGLSNFDKSSEERGYDRLWKFPEYLVLGAGEGANERWAEKTTFLGEIHSSLAGVLFYYGIPGMLLIFVILANIWASLPRFWLKVLLLAPLLYSLGTYNLRNSMFWLGLAVMWTAGKLLQQVKVRNTREVV